MTKGLFITLEGIDGTGKSTISHMLSNWLESIGHKVVLTNEPTDTWLGATIKRAHFEGSTALADTFLFLADRAEHVREIERYLESGHMVICDRYADSTIAYQGAAIVSEKENLLEWLEGLNSEFLKPDITLLLHIDPEKGLKRVSDRGEPLSKFETLSFLQKVQENYLSLASRHPDRIITVDSSGTQEEVFERIISEMDKKFKAQ